MAEKDTSWSPYRYAFDNPILFIDPDGNFELSSKNKSKYKHFDAILTKIGEKSNSDSRLGAVFSKHSGLSNSRTSEYLAANSGPTIGIGSTPGSYGRTYSGGTIVINKRDVKKLEKLGAKIEKALASGMSETLIGELQKDFDSQATKLEKTVLHEGVHAGDMEANGGQSTGTEEKGEGVQGFIGPNEERGWDFEDEYYDPEAY